MRSIQQFIREEVLRPKLQKAGVLVVYDPERRYRNLCCEMANEKCAVVDATESSIESREQALAWLPEPSFPRATVMSTRAFA